MEDKKFVIYMPIMDQYVRYDDRVLLFDSQEQVAQFKKDFSEFFKNSPGASVTKEATEEFLNGQIETISFSSISEKDIEKEKDVVQNGDTPVPPPSKEEMLHLLNTEFSPDEVASDMPSVFARRLIERGIIISMADFNYLALEAIQRAFVEDDEFPIHYYRKGEEMSESGRVVSDIGDCLTDDYIATNLANPT